MKAVDRREPDVRVYSHASAVLEGNPMGDPHVRRLPVYVPPGYDNTRREPYPTVYLLAGWSGRGARYLNDEGVFTPTLQEKLDELITTKQMPPVIVVFPDGSSRFGCSQYVNSEANGRYLDYVADEIVDWIDANFHTKPESAHRGVIGHSSGGFGAMIFGMLRADRFGAVCSSAGDSWYEFLYTSSLAKTVEHLDKAGGVDAFVETYLASPNPFGLMSSSQTETMLNLSMCPCYAPNLAVPLLKGDLYFDPKTGALVPEVWDKFLAWDPVLMVERYSESLGQLRWLHLEAGTEDEYGLHLGHRQIAAKLDGLGINYALEEYPGKHGGHHYRMPYRIGRMLETIV